jgi:hypothetical protein
VTFYVPRKRRRRSYSYRKKSGVYATPGSWFASGAGSTRESVLAAAEIFAAKARANAAKFSKRIPAATAVVPWKDDTATVTTDGDAAPNAAPFEFGERHPLYGNRKFWFPQPRRSYMSNAANSASTVNAAAEVYAAKEVELLAAEYGFDEV